MSLLNLHLWGAVYTCICSRYTPKGQRKTVGVLSPSNYTRVTDGHMNSTGSLNQLGV